MNLEDVKAHYNARKKIGNVYRRTGKNEVIADYYEELAEETGEENYKGNAERIALCAKFWQIDHYREQKVKDIKSIALCHDRFCDNCQNAQSIRRERKFAPVLDWFAERFDVYHIVFTVPNPYPEELAPELDVMYKNIGYMFRLFRGNAKIAGYDFRHYRCVGAVRSLEITKGKDGETFHPHFHCLVLLKRGLQFGGKHINSYSFNNTDVARSHKKQADGEPQKLYFTDFEILLQKIWRLRCDGERVNRKSIAELPEGYSVIMNKAKPKDYKEVFKYATKGIFNGKQSRGYNDFVPLVLALKNRRITQGYGAFRCIDFNMYLEQEDEEETDKLLYENLIAGLKQEELPVPTVEELHSIYKASQKEEITYISRRSISAIMAEDYGGHENQ